MMRVSPDVVSLLNRGPFPDRIDPWAEAGFTFQQLHGGMISALLQQLREPLASQGYFATREAALLISEARKPDIWIVDKSPDPEARPSWDYQVAAEGAHAEVGLAADVEALEGAYTEEHLPFPSLLTARDRAELLVRVEAWRERLAQLSATHENGA
jgi:hypothetical protein